MPAEREPTPRRRIKVSGEAPRGLSKAHRIAERAYAEGAGMDELGPMMDERIRSNDIIHNRPSSTRKKLVKEGNPKFIGPRQFSSEMAEDYESARGPEVLAKDLVRGRKKLRGGEDESQSISSEKLKALLQFLLKDKARIEAKFDHPGWDDVGQTFNI